MLAPAAILIVVAGATLGLLLKYGPHFPSGLQAAVGKFFLVVSFVETILIVWVLIYVGRSEWTLFELSFNDFWKEQLTVIYFVKEWMYSWLWNDLLDLIFSYLPAIVFLIARTAVTTALGIWFLHLSASSETS